MNISVPYVDLISQHRAIKNEIMSAVEDVIDSGQFVLGNKVQEFEKEFSDLCGVKFSIGVGNGTDALLLALKVLDIGEGDEVITVANSFISSASCIKLVGATPVLVDAGEDYNIDPSKLSNAVSPKTKAILPVHLTGRPCDMDAINKIAKKYGLHVIEDAAQAVGAEYKGGKVGALGDIGCFSLHPLKTLNACGDGGMITTNCEKIAKRLQIMRNLGLETRDNCVEWSSNSRLDSLQAAILLVKLKYFEEWTEGRRQNATFYRDTLGSLKGVTLPSEEKVFERPVYHTFVIQAEERDRLILYLREKGIGTAIHYPVPIHLSDVGKELGYPLGSFPISETQSKSILSLPVYPEVTKEKLNWVCENIKNFYSKS